jgi:hypothetical protein
VSEQLIEDHLAGSQGFRRRLGRFEVGTFGTDRAAGGRQLGLLAIRQHGGRAAWPAVVAGRAVPFVAPWLPDVPGTFRAGSVIAPWRSLLRRGVGTGGDLLPRRLRTRCAVIGTRPSLLRARAAVILAGRTIVPRAVIAGPVIATWAAIAVAIAVAWAIAEAALGERPVLARWSRQGLGRRGITLGRGSAQLGTWSGHDSSRLRPHAEDAPAAGRQDLEVEIIEADSKLLARDAEGFFDRLSREFAIDRHG